MLIYILIHLIGSILGYFLRRAQLRRMFGTYTTTDRKVNIIAHLLFSWIGLFATLIVYFLEENDDKPAKW